MTAARRFRWPFKRRRITVTQSINVDSRILNDEYEKANAAFQRLFGGRMRRPDE